MRTTLAIDDDILMVAKAMARQQDRSLGEIISELAPKALDRPAPKGMRNGVPLLGCKPGAAPVMQEMVNALREDVP